MSATTWTSHISGKTAAMAGATAIAGFIALNLTAKSGKIVQGLAVFAGAGVALVATQALLVK